jgi:transcriptional regulator with XRE-family HTH domain
MRLKDWLRVNNVSQAALAERLGVDRSTICRIVKGERTPKWALAEKIREITLNSVTLEDWARHDRERSLERADG